MKPRRIEPIWMSALGVFVAPLVCALNATLVAIAVGEIGLGAAPWFFLISSLLALLLCFPLGLISETIIKLWQSGNEKSARWFSAACGLFFLLGLSLFVPAPSAPLAIRKSFYYVSAGLLIPALWLIGFLLFALFARPAKT